jgi:hypothetical protein
LRLEKRGDALVDAGMSGGIGMNAVPQPLRIRLLGGPGAEEIQIGDGFGGRRLFDRRIDLRHQDIPVGAVRHPGQRGRAGLVHRREPDPAAGGRPRPRPLQKRPDMRADLRRRHDGLTVDELGIVDADGKQDEVSGLARRDLGGEPCEQIRGGIADDTQIIQKRPKIDLASGSGKVPLAQPLHPPTSRIPGPIGNAIAEDEDFVHRRVALSCVLSCAWPSPPLAWGQFWQRR